MAMATHYRLGAFKSTVMRDFQPILLSSASADIYVQEVCLVGLIVMQRATSSHQVLRHQREGVGGNMA